ncbi:hypothetical protein D3C72_2094810 [compost metagenome]
MPGALTGPPWLPAAATTVAPRSLAYLTARSKIGLRLVESLLKLRLRTLAPASTAYLIPAAAPKSVPPARSMTLMAKRRTSHATPATPIPLLPAAPMRPATWVPWPSRSMTSLLPSLKL